MKAILVCDDEMSHNFFIRLLANIKEIEVVRVSDDPISVLEYAINNSITYAVLDMETIKKSRADLDRYLKREIARAVMFGRFQFYVRGQLVHFANAKAKELLALCLDHRGGEVSMEEAVDKLWPGRVYDEKVKRLYRKAVLSLQTVLQGAGAGELFVTRRGACHVKADEIECDYYRFLETRDRKNCLFDGNYLFDYDWGEETLAFLERFAEGENFGEKTGIFTRNRKE